MKEAGRQSQCGTHKGYFKIAYFSIMLKHIFLSLLLIVSSFSLLSQNNLKQETKNGKIGFRDTITNKLIFEIEAIRCFQMIIASSKSHLPYYYFQYYDPFDSRDRYGKIVDAQGELLVINDIPIERLEDGTYTYFYKDQLVLNLNTHL
jgi:hypothetical protein